MKNKILLYLASGVKPGQVASLVGCSPGYISQLIKDPEFKATLEARILENPVPTDEALANKYDSAEHALLQQVTEQAPSAEFRDAVRGLEIIAKIQDMKAARKHPVLGAGASTTVQIVQLMLPQHVMRQAPVVQLNSDSEILSIDSNSLAPLSSDGVKNLFAQLREKNAASISIEQGL